MKNLKILVLFSLVLSVISVSDVFSASQRDKRQRNTKQVIYLRDKSGERYSENDCISVMVDALSRECYNESLIKQGVYSECANMSINDYSRIIDQNLYYVVAADDLHDYQGRCSGYKSLAIDRFLSQAETIEDNARESSGECVASKYELKQAKDCYVAIMATSGSYWEYPEECNTGVGRRFKKAGEEGLANPLAYAQNFSTMQFTGKTNNWREAVDAVLSGYMMKAKFACGEEDFQMVAINNFTPDERNNVLNDFLRGFSEQFGAQLGAKFDSTNSKLLGRSSKKSGLSSKSPTRPSDFDIEIDGSIFTIETNNLITTKSRLLSLLNDPDSYDYTNPIDITISKYVYGSTVTVDNIASFRSHIDSFTGYTSVFVLRSYNVAKNERVCTVLKYIGGTLVPLDTRTISESLKVRPYVEECSSFIAY